MNMEEARKKIAKGIPLSSKAKEFRRLLDQSTTERQVTPWLKEHPQFLARLVGGAFAMVFQNVPIGTKHPDFVVLDSVSAGWWVTLVELEPPGQPLFTKAGNPAARLAGAIKQVDDWRKYVAKERSEVLRRLADYAKRFDLLGASDGAEPLDSRGVALSHHESEIVWFYYVVIGRQHKLDHDEAGRKTDYQNHHNVGIMTYDHIVRAIDEVEVLRL